MIGLFDTHNNIFSLIASADPRTSDANTGYANLYNGQSATSLMTASMVNMTTGYGFIAKNGITPAHYISDGVDDEIDVTNSAFSITTTSTKTFRIKFKLTALGIQAFAGYYNLTTNENWWVGLWPDNRLNITWSDGISSSRYIGTTVLSIGVVYEAVFSKNGTLQEIYLNGVKETLTANPTMLTSTINYLDYSLFARKNNGVNSSATIYDFCDYSDSKSESWIKDQYYSSQNEWQGDLSGSDNGNGTLSLSADYEYLDAQQCWLDFENFVTIANNWGTGRIGQYKRQVVGFVDEVLARWDVSASYPNATIDSARVLMYSDAQGVNLSNATSNIYEQNQTSAENWTNGVNGPPLFDDFGIYTSWGTTLDSTTVQTSGVSYEFSDPSNNIKNLVQSWIDGTKSENDGVIIDANYQTISYYNDIFSIKLGIKILSSNKIIVPFLILNYLNQSL